MATDIDQMSQAIRKLCSLDEIQGGCCTTIVWGLLPWLLLLLDIIAAVIYCLYMSTLPHTCHHYTLNILINVDFEVSVVFVVNMDHELQR